MDSNNCCPKPRVNTCNNNDKASVRLLFHKVAGENEELYRWCCENLSDSFYRNFDCCRQVRPGVSVCLRHQILDKTFSKTQFDPTKIKLTKVTSQGKDINLTMSSENDFIDIGSCSDDFLYQVKLEEEKEASLIKNKLAAKQSAHQVSFHIK